MRALVDDNRAAEQGLAGWENRAELALILRADERSIKAVKGLILMEEFRGYLDSKKKELEKVALAKLMAGDKASCAVMRRLTPSFGEKIAKQWRSLSRFQKIKLLAVGSAGALIAVTWLIKSGCRQLDSDSLGLVCEVLLTTLDLALFVATLVIGAIVAVWFVLAGKPIRDKVLGPDPAGVDLLGKLAQSAEDPELKKQAMSALQSMLMGQEPNIDGATFLRSKASKYMEKAPEAMQAFSTLEHIFVLQQAGKSTASMHQFDEQPAWPGVSDVWPPTKYKTQEALAAIKQRLKTFLFAATVHPWMKKYAQHSGNKFELFQTVEVALSMVKNNEEEFDALTKLHAGNRIDTARLKPLQDIVDRLVHLDKHGSDPTNVREALGAHFRTGNVKQVFQELDEDGSGFLDRAECEKAAETLSEKLGFEMSQEDLDEAFAQMDKDGDGEIMLEEFSAWWKGFTSTTHCIIDLSRICTPCCLPLQL